MIQIHVDLAVNLSREQEMLEFFRDKFRAAAMTFEGFLHVDMLKLREAVYGQAPAGVNYRFVLLYTSEELRQKWLTSDIHQEVWGVIEGMLSSKDYDVLLFDNRTSDRMPTAR